MLRNSARPPSDGSRLSAIGPADGLSLRASQTYCRELTRREARNFYWGFVALPREQRMAIYALYGFARQVDDAADHTDTPRGPDHFAFHRTRLQQCFDGQAGDPVMTVLAHAVERFGIPRDDLEGLIRGVECDLERARYETWEDLKAYCLLVASSVGRMCIRVFGFRDPAALPLADDLGIAMQLANILRDVREDASMGRVYLPQEDLRRFDVDERALLVGRPGRSWESLMESEIARARSYFESGLRVTEYIPRRAGVCVLTMAGIYIAILDRLTTDPYMPFSHRASLSTKGKLGIMLRSWLQVA